jgi:hypothetical protein
VDLNITARQVGPTANIAASSNPAKSGANVAVSP